MQTLFIGKNTIFLPSVNSTNSYATQLLKNVNPPEGTVVIAEEQTGGKGQRGNTWESEPGSNLNATVILRPGFLSLSNQFFLYKITALAVYDALAELTHSSHIDIKIKWPNDILVNGKKIAGILIENNILNSSITWSIAGVGINVNQLNFGKLNNATSLALVTGSTFDIREVLTKVCIHLEKYYLALKNEKHEYISAQYLSHLYGLHARLNFEFGQQVRSLAVKGISPTGLLVLEDEWGKIMEADVKEIKWRY